MPYSSSAEASEKMLRMSSSMTSTLRPASTASSCLDWVSLALRRRRAGSSSGECRSRLAWSTSWSGVRRHAD